MDNLFRHAQILDREDPLNLFRDRFLLPRQVDGIPQVYLCGHSLGLQPVTARDRVLDELGAWADRGVGGHFEGQPSWMDGMEQLRAPLAELAGASADEVVVMNTLSVNLHLMMVSFFRPVGKRRKILMEKNAFPSDRYAVESQLRFHGLDPEECLIEVSPDAGGTCLDESRVEAALREQGPEIALVLWPGVQYASGQAFDLQRIATAARSAGACIGFDLAHSIGNLPLDLHGSGCDFAAWCNYKYLNGGPGALAACFIHRRHHGRADLYRFEGWWGHDAESRFRMAPGFTAAADAEAWCLSNPPVLSAAPLRASLDLFHEAGLRALRRKALAQSEWLQSSISQELEDVVELLSPADPRRRGCQLSMRVHRGKGAGRDLHEYLGRHGIVTDWREPDILRAAPVPLYNRFEDCYQLVRHVRAWAEQHTGRQ